MNDAELNDYNAWKRGDCVQYAGFKVQPKLDMPRFASSTHGWVVTQPGKGNVMPGATWAKSINEALQLIDVYIVVDGDANKFWHMLKAIQRSK